jgi:hypothetical protein
MVLVFGILLGRDFIDRGKKDIKREKELPSQMKLLDDSLGPIH